MKYDLLKNVFCQATGCIHFNDDMKVNQHCLLLHVPYDRDSIAQPVRIGRNGQCLKYKEQG
jgi:hypothetical protein